MCVNVYNTHYVERAERVESLQHRYSANINLLLWEAIIMAQRLKSSEKVTMLTKIVEVIDSTKSKNKVVINEFKEIVDKAKFIPVDNCYKTVAGIANEFEVVLAKDAEAVLAIAESISKDPLTDDTTRSGAKKVITDCNGILKANEFNTATPERTGDEDYTDATGEELTQVVSKFLIGRKEFIIDIASAIKKVEEDAFRNSLAILGKNNEQFTNSTAANLKNIAPELEALGLHINKKDMEVEYASAVNVGTVETKSFKAIPEI